MAKKLESLAMGNSDGYEIADTMIAGASRNGTWVCLKNVQPRTHSGCSDYLVGGT